MILKKQGYGYKDLTIVPARFTNVEHRKDINIFYEDGMLPIFASPMMTVVNEFNYKIYEQNKVHPVIPRTVKYLSRLVLMNEEYWVAFSLSEFNKLFVDGIDDFTPKNGRTYNVCIDMANGHMSTLYDATNYAKKFAKEGKYTLNIMVGNIANPNTYHYICEYANVDYVRLIIGSGANCLTSSNTGVHYPIATLIDECKKIKDEMEQKQGFAYGSQKVKCVPKLIADGGIRNYSDINKALALGADYVMIGSLFGQLLESAADMVIESKDDAQYPATYNRSTGEVLYYTNYQAKNINIWNGNTEEEKRDFIRSTKSIKKRQIGMSTKEAQRAMSLALRNPVTLDPDKLKTSEGITTFIECKYTLKQWLNNMMDYLRSAMSYTNAFDLEEFKNRTDLIVNSPAEIQSVNK